MSSAVAGAFCSVSRQSACHRSVVLDSLRHASYDVMDGTLLQASPATSNAARETNTAAATKVMAALEMVDVFLLFFLDLCDVLLKLSVEGPINRIFVFLRLVDEL